MNHELESPDTERRFGGISRLYGESGSQKIRASHVCVIGIGGVGSWSAEALARTGVGKITIVDLDIVAESNVNRQIHALSNTLGQAKVAAMMHRITGINPECETNCIEEFLTLENMDSILRRNFDVVIDAIDQVKAKAAMIAHCKAKQIPIVTTGAAGGKTDPTKIRVADLSRTVQDPLLSKVRSQLRKNHGFTRDTKKKFGITSIFSEEQLSFPEKKDHCEAISGNLSCSGFGSAVYVTSAFGMLAASLAINKYIITS